MRIVPVSTAVALLSALVLLFAVHHAAGAPVQAAMADPALVEPGRQLATAGDCAGCHGLTLKGGDPIASPMGNIYSSNITPDVNTGIGGWTLQQFADVLRKGIGPKGHIFPAMPYTSYTGLDDQQIRAIYSYLMLGVRPVAYTPPETSLPFPFVRPAMIGWNALFFREGRPEGAVDVAGAQLQRGRLLVETLEHCTACHTSRGQLMQPLSGRHLGGGFEGGWWAPNITRGGIGGWSDDRLATFLMTGHTDIAVAADDMGTVVSRSLSKLPRSDIDAMIAYLRAVPAVPVEKPMPSSTGMQTATSVAAIEPTDDTGWQAMLGHAGTKGDVLYQSACAACHGVDGKGSADLRHPSLRRIQSVIGPQGATLVQVIAHGVDRKVGTMQVLMPSFRNELNDSQIAALATYVRATFGRTGGAVNTAQVSSILGGEVGVPWFIRNAHWLSIAGMIVALLALVAIVLWLVRHRREGTRRAARPEVRNAG